MRVSILGYSVGNLHSLAKAIVAAGGQPEVVTSPHERPTGAAIVLPGVGAFPPAAAWLAPMRPFLRDAAADGRSMLGICLGMQLLLDQSEEGEGTGLGILPGRVTRLAARVVPQIGWNTLEDVTDPLVTSSGLADVYYANSFACRPDDAQTVGAWSTHETDRFPALVRTGRVVGVQFHPEKSSAPGLRFLQAFLSEARA